MYIREDGQVISNHLSIKKTLDILRSLSKGHDEPIREAYEFFNDKTNDAKNMQEYSELLNQAVLSVVHTKDESAIDSLFGKGGTTRGYETVKGLEDFELIAFTVLVDPNDV